MNIKIKNMDGKTMLVNWNRVDFVIEAESVYGRKHRAIHMGKQIITTSETIKKIEEKTKEKTPTFSEGWYNKQAKETYDELGK